MREILFHGKRIDNGEWVEGYFFRRIVHIDTFHQNTVVSAIEVFDGENPLSIAYYTVDPKTVGQFAGLTDKNGVKIFEGDVVRQTFEKSAPLYHSSWGVDEYEDLYGEDVGAVVIIPSKGVCIKNPVIHREVDGEVVHHGEKSKMYKPVCSGRCEVIGNIHDNPELLEGA